MTKEVFIPYDNKYVDYTGEGWTITLTQSETNLFYKKSDKYGEEKVLELLQKRASHIVNRFTQRIAEIEDKDWKAIYYREQDIKSMLSSRMDEFLYMDIDSMIEDEKADEELMKSVEDSEHDILIDFEAYVHTCGSHRDENSPKGDLHRRYKKLKEKLGEKRLMELMVRYVSIGFSMCKLNEKLIKYALDEIEKD